MPAKKSPIVVSCKPWPFKLRPGERRRKLCQWTCASEPRGAEFQHRRDGRTAVLHRSTKRDGWQVSTFDERGAIGDIVRPSCNLALRDAAIMPGSWKLKQVVALNGPRRKRR